MSNVQHASIAVDSDATEGAGAHRRERTIMGRTITRRTGLVTLVAALLLGLGVLAGATAGQLRSGEPAASVPAPIAVAAPWTGTCRSDVAGCVPEEQIVPGAPAALPAAWTGTCRAGSSGCEPDEALIPGVPVALPVAPASGDGQQARLYAIEVRDNGVGATAGDSGPCRNPGHSCDR